MAATIKSQMRIHVNAGNDIETPEMPSFRVVEYLP